jgi:hypothetical protein
MYKVRNKNNSINLLDYVWFGSFFAEVQQKWSNCMKAKGYDFSSVKESVDKYIRIPSPATSEEKATAEVDIQCKIETNLVGVAAAVQSAYDEQYIDSHREALQTWRQQIDDF